jgi:hypothetical protein
VVKFHEEEPNAAEKPKLYYIGDLPRSMAAVQVARMAAKATESKIYFIYDAPQCPNRLAVMLAHGHSGHFWEEFNRKMSFLYGSDERDWPKDDTTIPRGE